MAKLSVLLGALSLVAQTLALVSQGQTKPNTTIALPKANQRGSGIIKLPVTKVKKSLAARSQGDGHLGNHKRGKRQVIDAKTQNFYGALYLIDVTIGSNGQTVSLQIDTGSSDTWVNPNCTNSAWPSYCNTETRYNPTTSTTSANLGSKMQLGYGAGSVSGNYYTDSMTIGGAKISNQQFGVANTSSYIYTGIMGIGFGKGLCTNYYNVIDQLAAQGLINSRAFSLDIGFISTSGGSLTFGGIDSGKFSGTLSKTPIIPYQSAPEKFPRYWVSLNAVGSTRNISGTLNSTTVTQSGYSLGVILDSGTTMSSLPTTLVNAMLGGIAGIGQSNGQYTVPCALLNEAGASMDFTFGTNVIRVPFAQFMWNNGGTCYFGAVASDSVDAILGDTFLRGTYAVFDQDNMNIWMANAANCGSSLTTIGSGANAITSMVGQCAPPATATASVRSSTTSSSSTSTKLPTSTSSTSSTRSSTTTSSAGQTSSSSTRSSTTTSSAGQTSSSSSSSKSSSTTSSASYSTTFRVNNPVSVTSAKSSTVSTSSPTSFSTTIKVGAASALPSSSTLSSKSSSSSGYMTITVTATQTQAPVTYWSTMTKTVTVTSRYW